MADGASALRRFVSDMLKPWLHPRRFHAYGVGAMKTGTSSLGSMLGDSCRSLHEPQPRELARHIEERTPNPSRFLRRRDRRLWLEMESNHLLAYFIDNLLELFPKALFILTVRDCYTWLGSYINHHLTHDDTKDFWKRMREVHFGPRKGYSEFEKPLKRRGLYPLDGYLSYWTWHNRQVLETVPSDRLLVVKTPEITARGGEIADFLGIPREAVSLSRSHVNRARRYEDVVHELDPGFFAEQAGKICGPLMARLFPEIDGPETAFQLREAGR